MEIVLHSYNENLHRGRKEFVLGKEKTCGTTRSSVVLH